MSTQKKLIYPKIRTNISAKKMIEQRDSDTNVKTEEFVDFDDNTDNTSSTKSESIFGEKSINQDYDVISSKPSSAIPPEEDVRPTLIKTPTTPIKRSKTKSAERPTSKSRKQGELAEVMRKAKSNMNTSSSFHLQTEDETNSMISSIFIKNAKRSGEIKLDNRNLSTVPNKLWRIYELDFNELGSDNYNIKTRRDEDMWWNCEPLVSLDLSSNSLKEISGEIKLFGDLQRLYIFNNNITELPEEIGALTKLVKMDASRNNLSSLPKGFNKLQELKWLNLSHNNINELDSDFVGLVMLEVLDLSYNALKNIPIGVGFLIRLTEVNLSHNYLRDLPLDITNLFGLRKLDVSNNEISTLPNLSDLRRLEVLYAGNNNITEFPRFDYCQELKEIYLHDNYIKEIPADNLHSLTRLRVLDLHDNSLDNLPDEISLLQQLSRLNVQNNNLIALPSSMCLMNHLKSLTVEGNKFRSLRRDVVQCGISRIMKFLRERYDSNKKEQGGTATDNAVSSNISDNIFPTKYDMKYTKTLNLGNKNIPKIPERIFDDALNAGVTSIDLCKNNLIIVPERLSMLSNFVVELNLSTNNLTEIPDFISQFYNLKFLDLSKNMLRELPESFRDLSLKELMISSNKFLTMPPCVYDIKSLEVLSAHDNKIEEIDVDNLLKLEYLAVLDLANNNISKVPPELGKMTQLRTLNINGNNFRQPRYAILAKGTESVLAYLRDRIPL